MHSYNFTEQYNYSIALTNPNKDKFDSKFNKLILIKPRLLSYKESIIMI